MYPMSTITSVNSTNTCIIDLNPSISSIGTQIYSAAGENFDNKNFGSGSGYPKISVRIPDPDIRKFRFGYRIRIRISENFGSDIGSGSGYPKISNYPTTLHVSSHVRSSFYIFASQAFNARLINIDDF